MKSNCRSIKRKTSTLLFSCVPCIALNASQATNFIVIFLDDMGYGDLGCTGAIDFNTPNIDKLASEGILFTHFYSAQAVSGASRAGMLTGCYPNRIGLSGAPDHNSKHGICDDELTIGDVLKQRGYHTAAYGKWHLGHLRPFLPLQHGFDEYYGIPYSNDMCPNHPTAGDYYPDLPLIEGNETVELNPDQSKFTTEFTKRTIQFIDKNKKTPFFIYLAHPMPHVPLFVSDKFKGKSKQGLYGDVMMEIDWSVGEILKKLKKEGLEENTLVIFTSDNGPWLNYGNHAGSTGGLREGKGTSFEGGQRVPCIMRWKGTIKSGQICNKLTSNIDILPTIAAIANAPVPKNRIDGVDLTPLLLNKKEANPRKSFYYYYRKNSLEAVTDGRFKLIFPHKHRSYEGFEVGKDGQPGKVNEYREFDHEALYDLRRDPGERYNVIDSHPEIAIKLRALAEQAREDLGDDLTNRKGKNLRPCGKTM